MNVLDAQRTLDAITVAAGHDLEAAEQMERHFHRQVLEEVANRNPDSVFLACIAARTAHLFET